MSGTMWRQEQCLPKNKIENKQVPIKNMGTVPDRYFLEFLKVRYA